MNVTERKLALRAAESTKGSGRLYTFSGSVADVGELIEEVFTLYPAAGYSTFVKSDKTEGDVRTAVMWRANSCD